MMQFFWLVAKAITGKVNFIRINNDGSFEKENLDIKIMQRGSYKNPYLKNGDFIVIGKGAVATFVSFKITSPFVNIFRY